MFKGTGEAECSVARITEIAASTSGIPGWCPKRRRTDFDAPVSVLAGIERKPDAHDARNTRAQRDVGRK
jgi:hypothetical protein